MNESSADAREEDEPSLFDEAISAAEAWGQVNGPVTGMWLNRRHRTIGVGIAGGDEIETTEALRALVPPGISIRTRVASPRLAELWQLQADVDVYLEEEQIWERWGASLGVDSEKEVVEVGLLSGAPEHLADRLRTRFSHAPIVIITATRSVAL